MVDEISTDEEKTEAGTIASDEELLDLGANIQLSGFRDVDHATLAVIRKLVGKYGQRFSEICSEFRELTLNKKTIHEKEKSEKYEIHARLLDRRKSYFAHKSDMNLLSAIDRVLNKLENEISKQS